MSTEFTETHKGEVRVCIRGIVSDNFAVATFLQKIYSFTVEQCLRERISSALANASPQGPRYSPWIQYVFLPRALTASMDSRADDRLFDIRNIAPLADRLHGLLIGGKEEDVFNIVLMERQFRVEISPDKENMILSFCERRGERCELDWKLQEIMKNVLGKLNM
ncbi:MAG: hypothetical protein A2937_02540 [Candidatus Yonathbacteria bacterium RIFCSPLOWO2_01_FULL_47_33b]|uniref:Uncharacterized protein n=1 Tax=Candidatus Yonathbacteria bacterium RIFCSPLOWO2_01_FULL_47_33b TaxID=1802727 RepID=A0A1G2SGZ6_9BACT|nr:MAG: hypothetical protein A2937_02540 [Candidatus Yonathbacteria bacterium RIFCSPLOWO2_01_FULL_47_33b]